MTPRPIREIDHPYADIYVDGVYTVRLFRLPAENTIAVATNEKGRP